MEQEWRKPVDVFCRQYLQLEPVLTFPSPSLLRLPAVQEAIYNSAIADDAIQYGPPMRYQVKTLKELVSRIEASIDDWDQYVSGSIALK